MRQPDPNKPVAQMNEVTSIDKRTGKMCYHRKAPMNRPPPGDPYQTLLVDPRKGVIELLGSRAGSGMRWWGNRRATSCLSPSPLGGEGEKDTPHPRPLSPKGRGEKEGLYFTNVPTRSRKAALEGYSASFLTSDLHRLRRASS